MPVAFLVLRALVLSPLVRLGWGRFSAHSFGDDRPPLARVAVDPVGTAGACADPPAGRPGPPLPLWWRPPCPASSPAQAPPAPPHPPPPPTRPPPPKASPPRTRPPPPATPHPPDAT